MKKPIAFIGAGHIAEYLLKGFDRAHAPVEIILSDPDTDRLSFLARTFGCTIAADNQTAVDQSDLIILAVRPRDLEPCLSGLKFCSDHIVASVVAGADMARLTPLTAPARAVRVLPVSCVAINQSPILVHPDDPDVTGLFTCLGQVHVLPDEATFTPGTALVGAFYAWVFLLMNEAAAWTEDQGIDPETARHLVIETVQGACSMARHQDHMSLTQIWDTLATPGGISAHGAGILNDQDSIQAWSRALEAITRKMGHTE